MAEMAKEKKILKDTEKEVEILLEEAEAEEQKIVREKAVIDFLTDQKNFYLSDNEEIHYSTADNLRSSDVVLYRVDEISFEDKAPRKEALENVLSSMKMDGINFIYLILGDSLGVHFYYGVARNYSKKEPELNISDIGKHILEPSIKGNFRGSKITKVAGKELRELLNGIKQQEYYSMLEGVPGYVQDDEKFQGVDRLVDVMLRDTFGFMIIASPVNYTDLRNIESNLYDIYSKIVPLSKESIQEGNSRNTGASKGSSKSWNSGESVSLSNTETINISDGISYNKGISDNKSFNVGTSVTNGSSSNSDGSSKGATEGIGSTESNGTTHSEAYSKSGGKTKGTNESDGGSISYQKNAGTGFSNSVTVEFVNKKAQDWLKYLDEVIIPRLDYGNGKGVFITTSFLFSDTRACLKKLENTAISLYSGETGNKIPLRATSLENTDGNIKLQFLKNLQLPYGSFYGDITENEKKAHSALSQYISSQEFSIGNWLTTNELAMVAGLPKKDVVGLELKEEVEFGLNFKSDISDKNKMEIGKLIQSGNIIDKDVFLDKDNLDKHIFITGVTGSGKTTTCQNILEESKKPFLVIEPAKTEYRILRDRYPDMLIFTLGKDTVAPFRMNPFEFFPHESITSRVDMIQASIEASFEMEAAIPQLIESAIYSCYEDYGWNISTNKNKYYGEHAFDDGVYAFPTLEDLVNKIQVVVEQQGFDERLKNDYIGSIRARLMGLLVGAKGFMLNTKRSIDFKKLLSQRVVLELEEIRSATEKSLIMGFVLTNLMEAIKANYIEQCKGKEDSENESASDRCKHITLVEEAHRLLSKYSPGDSPNKKHGVETFSDMLAEIRKYGECLMIADQIPNKLTPEVLKNTNTKIVHRLFAADDKEAIGNTIVLEKEQKEFLSKLDTGSAVVFTQGFNKAIQVQINQSTDTTSNKVISEDDLQKEVYKFYSKQYKKGTIVGTQLMKKQPTLQEMKNIFELNREGALKHLIWEYVSKKKVTEESIKVLKHALELFGEDYVVQYLILSYFGEKEGVHFSDSLYEEKREIISDFVNKCINNEFTNQYYKVFFDAV